MLLRGRNMGCVQQTQELNTDRFTDEFKGCAEDFEALLGARLLVLVRVHEHSLLPVILLHVFVRRVGPHSQDAAAASEKAYQEHASEEVSCGGHAEHFHMG